MVFIKNSKDLWKYKHHGNTRDDYINFVKKLPLVYEKLNNGVRGEDFSRFPELEGTYLAFFKEPIRVYCFEKEKEDKLYYIAYDGNHRVLAAQELGLIIPVEIVR